MKHAQYCYPRPDSEQLFNSISFIIAMHCFGGSAIREVGGMVMRAVPEWSNSEAIAWMGGSLVALYFNRSLVARGCGYVFVCALH